MILSVRRFAILLLFSTGILPVLEGQNCSSGEFAIATLTVQNNEELNQKIRELFPKLTHRKRKIKFKVDTRIEYIPLYNAFENISKKEQILLDSLNNISSPTGRSNYDSVQRFDSYYINELSLLSPEPSANLTLRFSNCRPEYIVAEVLDGRLNFGRVRYGPVLHILFILDKDGFVDDIIYSSYTYN